jgi:hypothetical protein
MESKPLAPVELDLQHGASNTSFSQ